MTTKSEGAQVTLPNERTVEVKRAFRAPRARVYEAYTKPELLRKWLLGPDGWTMPVCDMDVRKGGKYRWEWLSEDGQQRFGFHGEFLEVDPPALLRHTEYFDPGSMGVEMNNEHADVTVRFDEEGGITTLTTLIVYASQADRDMALGTGMTDGMETSYQRMEQEVLAAA